MCSEMCAAWRSHSGAGWVEGGSEWAGLEEVAGFATLRLGPW